MNQQLKLICHHYSLLFLQLLILAYADSCLLQILFHRGLRLFPLKGFDWNLKQLYHLSQAYEEIKGDIHFFINLYRLIKSAGMNSQQVIRLLTIASIHLPSVEYRYENLKREEASLQADNHNSARTLQELSDQISELRKYRELYLIVKKKD